MKQRIVFTPSRATGELSESLVMVREKLSFINLVFMKHREGQLDMTYAEVVGLYWLLESVVAHVGAIESVVAHTGAIEGGLQDE